MINTFTINQRWRLVDLPGYGFAQVARKDRSQFSAAVAEYLKRRANLCCVFALIDSGLPPQKIDLDFVEWLARNSIPFVLVFTKTDTVTPAKLRAHIDAFMGCIAAWFEKPPAIFTSSATTRQGRKELFQMIDESLAAIEVDFGASSQKAASSSDKSSSGGRAVKVADDHKKRPDRSRPW
jgi:GTP-binding protein